MRICLVTPGHVASTPRLVKEADALAAAGYDVHVVFGRSFAPNDLLDAEILRSAHWKHTAVTHPRGLAALPAKLRQRLARRRLLQNRNAAVRTLARAQHTSADRLAAAASAVAADLYLGHCLAGLPAAAAAAAANGARYGFDAEDFHEAETNAVVGSTVARLAVETLQARLLPGAAHRTAAAPLIGAALESKYSARFTTILNVFPLAEAPDGPTLPRPISDGRPARIYWFSQTIGRGRGLEAVVEILARMKTPVELCLRGFSRAPDAGELRRLAGSAGLRRPIVFLPPAFPAEMARLAADADLGLSVEASTPLNRDLCLTNKIFTYLLAGVPVVLSPTSAQRALADELGEAAVLLSEPDPVRAAGTLDELLQNRDRHQAARDAAWQLAQSRYNWDREKEKLLESIRAIAASIRR